MEIRSKMNFSRTLFDLDVEEPGCVIGSVEGTVWCLRYRSDGKDYLELTRLTDNGEVKIDIEVRFRRSYILSNHAVPILEGQKSVSLECFNFVPTSNNYSLVEGYVTVRCDSNCTRMEEFTQTNDGYATSEKILPNCKLTTRKELDTQTEDTAKVAEKSIPSTQLANNLLHLFDNPDSFSDVTLVCGTIKIPAHRNILSARSAAFAERLKTQMQEGSESVLEIVDMEPDVLKAMLRYIYSGKTDHLTLSLAENLLSVAGKYQLEELKSICVEELKTTMDSRNVFRSVVLGDMHDQSLKAYAMEYICQCKYFSNLQETEEWLSFLKERPLLAVEVTTAIVGYLQNKRGFTMYIPLVNN